MKKILKMLLIGFVALTFISGCATLGRVSVEEKITLAYATAGKSMVMTHTTWKELREAGKVTDEQNAKFNVLFNKAKETYKVMGTTEQAVISSLNVAEKQGNIAAFNEAANRLPEILLEIDTFIKLVKGGN